MTHGPHLIAYADRFGGDLRGLQKLLDGPLADAFDGVHVLPFFTPFDGTDAGFDPDDHTAVDPRLGGWDDVRALADDRAVMADVIVNHVSARSAAFLDVRERGDASPSAGMFLTLSSVFPDGATEEDLVRIYRPRPGLPFTAMRLGDRQRLVWTTFTPDQVDLDLRDPGAWEYVTSVIDHLVDAGVTLLRLDAVGYVGKAAGTSCFMTPEAFDVMRRISDHAHARGAQVLVEVHGHHTEQIAIAAQVDLVYDFALPPLVLHALTAGTWRRWRTGTTSAPATPSPCSTRTTGSASSTSAPATRASPASSSPRRSTRWWRPSTGTAGAAAAWRPARPRPTSTSTRSTARSTTHWPATTTATSWPA